MTWGPVPVRAVERSSPKVTSLSRSGHPRRTDPVQLVLDLPVAADPDRELGWRGLAGGQRGDGVAGLGAPSAAGDAAGPAGDLDGLGGVGEKQARGDGDRFDDAFLDA